MTDCNWNSPINILIQLALFLGGMSVALSGVIAYLGWQWKDLMKKRP